MERILISVEPGICGFCCQVEARRLEKQRVLVEITGSDCTLIRKFAASLEEVRLTDIFTPHTRNPVFKAAEKAGCHLSCPVPVAVMKAAEVALELALPRAANMCFVQDEKKDAT
jgi:hypothetical protein